MQPRGQLWFEFQRVCQDFRDYSGLTEEESLRVLVGVLSNLLADTKTELEKLSPTPRPTLLVEEASADAGGGAAP
jgi:hypothetical protein